MTTTDSVEEADIELGKALASEKEHPWVRAFVKAGELGDQGPLYTAAGGVIVAALATWNSRRARLGVSMLLAAAAADLAKSLTKRAVRRTRPHVLLDNGRYESAEGGSEEKKEQSFPSGHVACSLAVARAICRQRPGSAPWATAAVLTVALARLAKGAHWPLDVAAGAILGLGAEAASSLLLRWLRISQEPETNRRRASRHRL